MSLSTPGNEGHPSEPALDRRGLVGSGVATLVDDQLICWEFGTSGADLHPSDDALVRLACIRHGEKIRVHRLLPLAQETGPLFGERRSESIDSWVSAIALAKLAIELQRVVNGKMKPAAVARMQKLVITRLEEVSSYAKVSLYVAKRQVFGEYLDVMSDRPVLVKLVRDGLHCYGFASLDRAKDIPELGIYAFLLEREISQADYLWLRGIIGSEALDDAAREQLGLDLEEGIGIADEAQFRVVGEGPGDTDGLAFEVLVQTIVSAHLGTTSVDPFSLDPDTGILAFPCALSWLWYRFAHILPKVDVGFCRHCGLPYSLVHTRGRTRGYCSRDCKTKASNDEARRLRDEARVLFDEGKGVTEIAEELFGAAPKAERHVRTLLSTWPTLKRRCREAIADSTSPDRPFLQRCLAEGVFQTQE